MEEPRQIVCMGTNIRRMRSLRGMTQEQVIAQMQLLGCDITRSVLSRYETGKLNIQVSHLIALKEIFNCSYEEFFRDLAPGEE